MAVQFLSTVSVGNSRCRKKRKKERRAIEICGLFHTWRWFSFRWGAAAAADAVLQPWHFRVICLLFCCIDRHSLDIKNKKTQQQLQQHPKKKKKPLFTSQFTLKNHSLAVFRALESLGLGFIWCRLFALSRKTNAAGSASKHCGAFTHGTCPDLFILKTPSSVISCTF